MGELKTLREQQETLVARAKELNHKLFLAGLGIVSKAEAESGKLLDKYAAAGAEAFGAEAEGKARALLVARGLGEKAKSTDIKALADSLTGSAKELIDSLPEKRKAFYEQLVEAGREESGDASNELALAGLGALAAARSKGQSLFNELVAAGSSRQG